MDRPAFEQLVAQALKKLPAKFRKRLHNIVIEIEDYPSQMILDDMGIKSGSLFGLYQGVPLTEREWNYGNVLPDRIVIYQRPIERVAATEKGIEDMVLDTVMHEIGHYFGFNDAALYAMKTKKGKNGLDEEKKDKKKEEIAE